jgi:hypothetical protein
MAQMMTKLTAPSGCWRMNSATAPRGFSADAGAVMTGDATDM